jgi:hypothetical protein
MQDTLSTEESADMLLKRDGMRLKIWEAIAERAYKIFALGLAGNLAAAIFTYPAAMNLRKECTATAQKESIRALIDSIPSFIVGAEFAMIGLATVWIGSGLIQSNL